MDKIVQMAARAEAIEYMEAVRRNYRPHVPPPDGALLDAIPADILRALADERRMNETNR